MARVVKLEVLYLRVVNGSMGYIYIHTYIYIYICTHGCCWEPLETCLIFLWFSG